MSYAKQFIVKPGENVKLSKVDPGFTDGFKGKKDALGAIAKHVKRIADLQYALYAENKQSLLICLQALDAGGKDGTIRHCFAAMNPQGCRVAAFKQPTEEERNHDFLWRVHRQAPRNGEVVIFNRSHYEDVLVVRVHKLAPKSIWSKRYAEINRFERLLSVHNTRIVKFFLHISPEEQLARFKRRLDLPEKHWKISDSDYKEREYWGDYIEAFEDALSKCSTAAAPWYVIPADKKWFRNLAVSEIVADTLESMKPKVPAPTVDIDQIRREYHEAVEEANGAKKGKKS